jgi:hypothetical protein
MFAHLVMHPWKNKSQGGYTLKAKIVLLTIVLLLAVSVSFADDVEKYCGIWVNTNYNNDWSYMAKWIMNPDGSGGYYFNTWDTIPRTDSGKLLMEEKWVDSEGNTFYKVKFSFYGDGVWNEFHFWRINSFGTICEGVRDNRDFPTKIDPNDFAYMIHYRYQ